MMIFGSVNIDIVILFGYIFYVNIDGHQYIFNSYSCFTTKIMILKVGKQ